MRRNDLHGRRAPRWLNRLLVRRYGTTPFGEPRYRLVWAPARIERSGGEWTDWQAGRVARRITSMRSVPKYPGQECWLLERWTPASHYGTPEQWYRPVAQGGTVLPCGIAALGDYPYCGDYEDLGARLYWYPTERHVTLAIDACERGLQASPVSPAARARQRTLAAEDEQQRRDADFDQDAAALFDDAAPAFGGAPMVGYGGSHRPALVEMAERIGIRQHPL